MKFMEKKIVLKSCNLSKYPDLEIVCKVIENNQINDYLSTIPESEKFIAVKTAPVAIRVGKLGEVVHTELYTVVDGKKYLLQEESNTVCEREMPDGSKCNDIVVTNINSTSNENYVVKANKFFGMYTRLSNGLYAPVPEERQIVRVSENIIIKTAWGTEALCLKGSYIVIYNEKENDFNTLESGAGDSTYDIKPKFIDNDKITTKSKTKNNI